MEGCARSPAAALPRPSPCWSSPARSASGCAFTWQELAPELPEAAQSSVILAADGTPILTLHAEENRSNVAYGDIPASLIDAVIAIEDERFWLHHGVDLRAIMRAVQVNATEGQVSQGGSTITQQLVKLLLLSSDQTLDRKVAEAALAWQLEERYTKERILELYLNTIYFGSRRLRRGGRGRGVLRQAARRAHRRRGGAARRADPARPAATTCAPSPSPPSSGATSCCRRCSTRA